jgi:hypothetical protein
MIYDAPEAKVPGSMVTGNGDVSIFQKNELFGKIETSPFPHAGLDHQAPAMIERR